VVGANNARVNNTSANNIGESVARYA
jgi:hypothetical protein